MKINVAERMSPCEALWAESEDRHTFAHTSGMEASLDDSTAPSPTCEEQEEEVEEVCEALQGESANRRMGAKPKRRAKVRRLTQALRRETLEF